MSLIKKKIYNLISRIGKFLITRCWASYLELIQKRSPECKASQKNLFTNYVYAKSQNASLPSIWDVGFRVFSQNEEDGILLYILALIGIKNQTFVEIGTQNGIECNCANLAINLGWHGLFIDMDEKMVSEGKDFYEIYNPDTKLYPPRFKCAKVTPENINDILLSEGFEGEVDVLSIDIDGNDYWIWDAINVINPRIVVIETHVEFGLEDIIMPYTDNPDPEYHGASVIAMTNLAHSKGYELIGTIRFAFNLFFLRKDLSSEYLPEINPEDALFHRRNEDMKYSTNEMKSLKNSFYNV